MSISWWPRTGAPASIPVGLPPRPARDQRVKLPRGVISSTASRPRPDRSGPCINHPPASRSSWVPSPQPTALWSTAHAPRSLRDDLGDVRLTDTSVKIVSPSSKVAAATDTRHNGSPGFFDRVPDLAEQAVRTRIDLGQGGRVSGDATRRFVSYTVCQRFARQEPGPSSSTSRWDSTALRSRTACLSSMWRQRPCEVGVATSAIATSASCSRTSRSSGSSCSVGDCTGHWRRPGPGGERSLDGRNLPVSNQPVHGAQPSARLSSRGVSAGHLDDGLDLYGEPERQCGHPDGGPGRPADAVAEGTNE